MKYFFTVFIVILMNLVQPEVFAQTESMVQIKNSKGEGVSGVYMVNKTRTYLITSSDEEGRCYFDAGALAPTDSIQFASLGFEEVMITARELEKRSEIFLSEKTYDLQEVAVSDIRPETLLKKAAALMKKPKGKNHHYQYYGKGQYMKITQCNGKAVEYRREYGAFFTSGNILRQGKWDEYYRFDFVSAYMARSYNLMANGQDTLYPLYIYKKNSEYNYSAPVIKIHRLNRAILLDGPIFTSLKYYQFRLIDNNQNYTYEFRSKPRIPLSDLRISCNGTLTIDPETARLRNITIDYIDYNMIELVRFKKKVNSPYSTRARLEIGWTPEGQPYIKSCRQETIWQNNPKITKTDSTTFIGTSPSRRAPAKNKLIEKEAFVCESYDTYPYDSDGRYYSLICRAMNSICGEYDSAIFASLPEPIDGTQAKKDLSQYRDLEEQFKIHSNKRYIDDPSIHAGHPDIFHKNYGDITLFQYAYLIEVFRQRITDVFFKGKDPETMFTPVSIPN